MVAAGAGLLAGAASAQLALPLPLPEDDSGVVRSPARARVGLERITLPGNESLGLYGTTYLVDLGGSGFAVGPAAYGGITGQRGGFFTIGGELSYTQRLTERLRAEVGLYAGGGGGGGAPQGGGLMLRPHADLLWDLGGHSVGVSLSQVRFPSGSIDSSQLGLVWNVNSDFRWVPPGRIGTPVQAVGRPGLGFDRVQAVVGAYRPKAGALRASGGQLPPTIGYVGLRAEQSWGRYTYWGLEANGAASGGVAGYAEYLATVGAETPMFTEDVHVGARLALGAGGGGDIDVGGGLLGKASVYAALRVSRRFGIALEGGLTRAPQGSFKGAHGSANLIWILDDPNDVAGPTEVTRTEFVGGMEQYDAARRDGSTRRLQAAVLKINRFVGENVYLTGQAHSATGGGAGGYSTGYFGGGYQQPLGARWLVGAELLAGAAGGGGVDTSGGFLVQPMAYVGYRLSPSMSLRAGAGRVQAASGPLASTVFDLGLVFTYGLAGRGFR